ncbi:MAG: type II toxin-antitoxin system RelB/DinJ family antitoxin [Ruminococcus sp.]|nr:type II toxin-antitoxin system RelB/DinJ family antitoxin [Ruminococcus sp.]
MTQINFRIDEDLKVKSERVLKSMGLNMSSAITMFLTKVSVEERIPFEVTVPKLPASISADLMTAEEIHSKLAEGYNDALQGNIKNASVAFEEFRRSHG